MKTIKEVSGLTGISEQNIRYYERQKLLFPKRNQENAYREYSEEDINRLKMIRLFRKLDMPMADIRKLFKGEVTLEDALSAQIQHLEAEKERLEAALAFCRTIHETSLEEMDVDTYLHEMENKEKEGFVFAQFMSDYAAVVRSEMKREFSFMPDTRCDSPEEFTEELLKYAKENKVDLIVTKESMTPRFEIDGIEYRAWRTSGRWGIVVRCEMTHPEDYLPDGMSQKKYRRYRILSVLAFPVLLFLIGSIWMFRDRLGQGETVAVLVVFAAMFIANACYLYYGYGKNFKG